MKRAIFDETYINKDNSGNTQYLLANLKNKSIFVMENGNYDLLFDDLPTNANITIKIKNNANVKLSFFSKTQIENLKIDVDCMNDSSVDIYYADFSIGTNKVDANIMLKEPNSRVNWHLASLTSKNDNKIFNISVYHESKNTYGKVENYGVCKDFGKLLFAGVSSINNGSVESETYQKANIMVFDKDSVATAKPILKIDENDIIANHSAVVGKVNDEHLFYLMSRGLSESEAKEIITYGYLKPILEGFVEEELKDEITSLIEGRM